MNEQSPLQQDKTQEQGKKNVKNHIYQRHGDNDKSNKAPIKFISKYKEFEERDLNIEGDCSKPQVLASPDSRKSPLATYWLKGINRTLSTHGEGVGYHLHSFFWDNNDDVDIEEEEHLAPTNSTAVALPAVDHAPSAEETEPFETDKSAATPPPHPAY
ncbi:hypothetical protein Tco_0530596 [Tanacetum coccineum]